MKCLTSCLQEVKTNNKHVSTRALLTLLVALIASICAPKPATGQKKNVLFLTGTLKCIVMSSHRCSESCQCSVVVR